MNPVDNYVPCGYKRAWLLFDLDNGHSNGERDVGKGYVWVFRTQKEAINHKKAQKGKSGARLTAPIRVSC